MSVLPILQTPLCVYMNIRAGHSAFLLLPPSLTWTWLQLAHEDKLYYWGQLHSGRQNSSISRRKVKHRPASANQGLCRRTGWAESTNHRLHSSAFVLHVCGPATNLCLRVHKLNIAPFVSKPSRTTYHHDTVLTSTKGSWA